MMNRDKFVEITETSNKGDFVKFSDGRQGFSQDAIHNFLKTENCDAVNYYIDAVLKEGYKIFDNGWIKYYIPKSVSEYENIKKFMSGSLKEVENGK
jgi:hypothetical protein